MQDALLAGEHLESAPSLRSRRRVGRLPAFVAALAATLTDTAAISAAAVAEEKLV